MGLLTLDTQHREEIFSTICLTKMSTTMSSIQSTVPLDILQFAVAQVILLGYHSLPLIASSRCPEIELT